MSLCWQRSIPPTHPHVLPHLEPPWEMALICPVFISLSSPALPLPLTHPALSLTLFFPSGEETSEVGGQRAGRIPGKG